MRSPGLWCCAVLCCAVLCCAVLQPATDGRYCTCGAAAMTEALAVAAGSVRTPGTTTHTHTHTHNSYSNKLVTAAAPATDQTMLQYSGTHWPTHPPTYITDSTPSQHPSLDAEIINLSRVKCDGAGSAIQHPRAPRVSISDSCLPGI